MIVDIPISIGELVDKITILQIKQEKIIDQNKLKNIQLELQLLSNKLSLLEIPHLFEQMSSLYSVNKELWNIEDDIRKKEKIKQFDNEFVELARSVYYKNDKRAALKKEINILVGSTLVEEKQYDEYR
jgi:hypothetical protein